MLHNSARLWPLDLYPIQLGSSPQPKHHAWIVRGKITAAANFHAAALQVPRLIRDYGAQGVDISLFPHQLQPNPVVLVSRVVLQENRSLVITRDQDIHRAVVIEVTQRQSTPGDWTG